MKEPWWACDCDLCQASDLLPGELVILLLAAWAGLIAINFR